MGCSAGPHTAAIVIARLLGRIDWEDIEGKFIEDAFQYI